MIHIIVTAHGKMAEGMIHSAAMLIGEAEGVDAVSFEEEMGIEELRENFENKITDISNEKQYLILCDIKGGTPFNTASRYSYKNDNVAVFFGVNLPILIAAISEREGSDLKRLSDYLEEISKETVGVSEI